MWPTVWPATPAPGGRKPPGIQDTGCYLVRNLTSCYLTHTGIQFSPLLHRTTTGSTDHRIAMKVFSQLGVLWKLLTGKKHVRLINWSDDRQVLAVSFKRGSKWMRMDENTPEWEELQKKFKLLSNVTLFIVVRCSSSLTAQNTKRSTYLCCSRIDIWIDQIGDAFTWK